MRDIILLFLAAVVVLYAFFVSLIHVQDKAPTDHTVSADTIRLMRYHGTDVLIEDESGAYFYRTGRRCYIYQKTPSPH